MFHHHMSEEIFSIFNGRMWSLSEVSSAVFLVNINDFRMFLLESFTKELKESLGLGFIEFPRQ
jgi:hypothetical protein